jgi:hypothetical protein
LTELEEGKYNPRQVIYTFQYLEIQFHGRRAAQIENEFIRLTVTVEGGHIAEMLEKKSGVNPLWIPPWTSIEPSVYSAAQHPEYGASPEAKLLAGIMGHNTCLDLFGPPSVDEERAGITVHGEASVLHYQLQGDESRMTATCTLPVSQLAFERRFKLDGPKIRIAETVENLSALDRPIAWTEHVTLGPPFLESGVTQFRAPAAPKDFELYTDVPASGGYSTHLLDPHGDKGWFFAYSPKSEVVFGYVWRRSDFPWLGVWEENCSRKQAPWNGRTQARGMEFGVSPFPETRREMIERQTLFDTACYRWLPARGRLHADYYAAVAQAAAIPETIEEFEYALSSTCRTKI